MFGTRAPASGPILAYIVNTLKNYNFTISDWNEPVTYHRIVEAFKWAYALRMEMGDPEDPDIADYINQVIKLVLK